MLRLGIGISGGGTTAARVIKECLARSGRYFGLVEPVFVSASRQCEGIDRCVAAGLSRDQILIRPRKGCDNWDQVMLGDFQDAGVNVIMLLGYTLQVPQLLIEAYDNRICNQHPGPLDPGRRYHFGGRYMMGECVHELVLAYNKAISGQLRYSEATAHLVTAGYDEGLLVETEQFPITTKMTVTELKTGLLTVEHEVQLRALGRFLCGPVTGHRREQPLIDSFNVPTFLRCKHTILARRYGEAVARQEILKYAA